MHCFTKIKYFELVILMKCYNVRQSNMQLSSSLLIIHSALCYYTDKRQVIIKVSKGAKIRSRYNQVPHPTQDTNGKVTNSQLDTTNKSREVSPFQAGDHKAHINRRAQRHSKHKTEQKHQRSTKEVPP